MSYLCRVKTRNKLYYIMKYEKPVLHRIDLETEFSIMYASIPEPGM